VYANKNKTKNSKARTVATGADSTKLSSTDSRYDAGDYEAVPASIRKIRDARNKKLEEQNAIPAEEIIARQEAEIAELKRQAAAGAAPKTMADKYRSAIDDIEDHPTFKNPESMADFGDYEAVASTARFAAADRDPNQKVFRAKPSVATRKVASPSDLSPGDYEAVAAAARHAVSPDEYLAAREERNENAEETSEFSAPAPAPARSSAPADNEVHSEPYTPPKAAAPAASSDDAIHSEPYTPPKPAAPAPAPIPAPAPVSAADYTVQNYSASAPAPAPAPAPVSAADYTVQSSSAPATSSRNDNSVHVEPYTPPAQRTSSGSSSYSAQAYVPPAQRAAYSDDGNYDVGGGPIYSPTSGKRIASFENMAPGDYEAVADSSYDDSDMDLADGSYDFDKFLADAPSLQMQPAPAPSPEESEWADLGTDSQDSDDVEITDEQTRALAEALAQETLSNQPGMQFEDIIDNVIAKVMERKQAEDAAKAASQQPAQPEQPEQPTQPEQPAQPEQPEQPEQQQNQTDQQVQAQQQNPAQPQQEQNQTTQQPAQNPDVLEQTQTAEEKHGLTPGAIDPSTPIEDIPALILAELDSADEVSDDDIKKSIDAALIGKLTTGELTLDSVQSIRNKILDEIHEMQEEEARILAQLEGKPEKHPFDPDFLPADIAVEDIPDAVIAELDCIDGEVTDEEVKQSIDKVMIAKLAKGDLTLDSFQEARDSIFDALGIETAEEQAEAETEPEPEEKPAVEPQPEPVVEPEPETVVEPEPETVVEPEPVAEPTPEPIVEPQPEPVVEQESEPFEELEEEPVTGPEIELVEDTAQEPEAEEEPVAEPEIELVEDTKQEPGTEFEAETEESEAEESTETEASPEELPSEESEAESASESEHAPESKDDSSEDDEEEEEQTTPIRVPKEPTVLEYDPYADVFVNPPDDYEESEKSEEAEKEEASEEPEEEEASEEPEESEEEASEEIEESPAAEEIASEESEESPAAEEIASEESQESPAAEEEASEEGEGFDDGSVEAEESEESAELTESDEMLETPLSAAAVLAMQDQLDEQQEEAAEEESIDSEPVTAEESAEEEPVEETVEEPVEDTVEKPVEEIVEEPVEEAAEEPVEETVEEPVEEITEEPVEETTEEPAEETIEEPVEETTEEPEAETVEEPEIEAVEGTTENVETEPKSPVSEPSGQDDVLDMQITFDDIFRNPFVNDFEPIDPFIKTEESAEEPEKLVEEPEPEAEPDVEEPTQEETEEGSVETAETEYEEVIDEAPAEETIVEEPAQEETEEESVEAAETESEVVIDEAPAEETIVEEPSQEESEAETDNEPQPVAQTEEQEPEAEPDIDETEVDQPVEVAEPEQPVEEPEPDEYVEAKAKRHEDMQNALLMAMIDDKEKTFSDAVNYMINQDELNAKTLRTRMPIDRDTLDRVIKEREFIPDKKTAIAICFALRLTWEDSIRLLYKAGYSLNDTERYDLTIEYLMRRGVYDQNMINSVLMGSGLEGFGIPQSEI